MNHGITPSHRGILLGLTTVPKLLALADAVEASPALDSLVGWGMRCSSTGGSTR